MKTVLITGASKGIGKATALLFQRNGWNVAATMRDPEKESDLTVLKNVKCYQLDVTDDDSIRRCLQCVTQDFGNIDVLVNNAGVYTTKPLEMNSENDIHRIINTNIIGTIRMTQMILPYFRSRKEGIIINISSIAGKSTFPFQSLYHTTKWAIEGMSEGLQHELKKLNIKVKIVEPGMVKTNLYDLIQNLSIDNYPADYKNSFKNWHGYLIESFNKGYGPDVTGKTIYKAATDQKSKLRYASGSDTKMIFLLRNILPFTLFTLIVRKLSRI
jgi:NADP-dependent 3-hydroxy acid dehydrogenase YdfG